MDNFMKRVYIGEIETQCQFALNAIINFNFALGKVHSREEMSSDQRNYFHKEVFRQIHSFLTHTSNVSRLFWPVIPGKRKRETEQKYLDRLASLDRVQRANSLKEEFDPHDVENLKNRTLRDHLEHYDERLDHWRSTSVNKNIASDTIGSRNAIVGLDESDMMRWFDPTKNFFLFRGEQYDLQSLANAIQKIKDQSGHLKQELWERAKRAIIPEEPNKAD